MAEEDPGRHWPFSAPSPWPAPHLAAWYSSHAKLWPRFGVPLLGVSEQLGGTGVGRGALEVRQWEWRILVGGRGGGKRSLILEECLAVMAKENGKIWCSCLDHCRMKLSSARLFRGGTGDERHGMGIRTSTKVRWGKPKIDTDLRVQDCLMREEHVKKDMNTWEHSFPTAQERSALLPSLSVFLQVANASKTPW